MLTFIKIIELILEKSGSKSGWMQEWHSFFKMFDMAGTCLVWVGHKYELMSSIYSACLSDQYLPESDVYKWAFLERGTLIMRKERGPSVHFSCSKMSAEELSELVLKKVSIDKVETSFLWQIYF